MPHRDPETGQFLSHEKTRFTDHEVASFTARIGIPAADMAGATGFSGEANTVEGIELLDYDDIVDRNEELVLLHAEHYLSCYANSTETEDGTLRVMAEISASPSNVLGIGLATADLDGDFDGATSNTDSIDLLGRPLVAVSQAPFSDSATGMGGGGDVGDDEVTLQSPPGEVARFHPRDELFTNLNMVAWNIDDSGAHIEISGQHVYGVVDGC